MEEEIQFSVMYINERNELCTPYTESQYLSIDSLCEVPFYNGVVFVGQIKPLPSN